MESIEDNEEKTKAIELLANCKQSLLEEATDLDRFFRIVARVRGSLEAIDEFDETFQNLLLTTVETLDRQGRIERAFKMLDIARRKCGEMLRLEPGRTKLYRVFEHHRMATEAAMTIVSGLQLESPKIAESFHQILQASDDPARLEAIADQAEIRLLDNRPGTTPDGIPQLPMPGGLGEEQTTPGAPGACDDNRIDKPAPLAPGSPKALPGEFADTNPGTEKPGLGNNETGSECGAPETEPAVPTAKLPLSDSDAPSPASIAASGVELSVSEKDPATSVTKLVNSDSHSSTRRLDNPSVDDESSVESAPSLSSPDNAVSSSRLESSDIEDSPSETIVATPDIGSPGSNEDDENPTAETDARHQEPDNIVTASDLFGRLTALGSIVDNRQEPTLIRIGVDDRPPDAELLVVDGRLVPAVKIDSVLWTGPSVEPDDPDDYSDRNLACSWALLASENGPLSEDETTGVRNRIATGLYRWLSAIPGDKSLTLQFETPDPEPRPPRASLELISLIEATIQVDTGGVPAVARRVFEAAADHDLDRWLFVEAPEDDLDRWLPCKHRVQNLPAVEDLDELADEIGQLVETARFGDDETGLAVFFRDESRHLFVFDDGGGCLVELRRNLLGAMLRISRQLIDETTGSSSSQPESKDDG